MYRFIALVLASSALASALPAAAADGAKPHPKGMMPMALIERLDRLGGDGKDGAEALAAWSARLKERRPEEFAKLDADGDGTISPAEAKAARDHAEQLLKDAYPELFARFDTDHDGHLSRTEVAAARETLRGLRKDHPGDARPEPAAAAPEVKDHPTGPAPRF